MGFFDSLFPKREIDPALKQQLIKQGKNDKLQELQKAISEPSSLLERGTDFISGFTSDKQKALRFEVEPGSPGEQRIKEIVEEERPKREGAMEFRVGEGLENEVDVRPGPRIELAKAMQEGANIRITDKPERPSISEKGAANLIVQRSIAIAAKEAEAGYLPDISPDEKKRIAASLMEREAQGQTLNEGEQEMMDEGVQELIGEALGFASLESKIVGGAKKLGEKQIKNISRKVVSQRFRTDKLNLPEENIKAIEKRLEVLGLKNRTVKTFGEMEQAALELGATPEQLLKESITKRITDNEVVALRNNINSNSQFISQSEKKILQNPDLERELGPKIQKAEQQLNDALNKLVTGGTEAGRAVASFRIIAKNNLDYDFWLKKAQKEFGRGDLPGDAQRAIRELIDEKDVNGLAEFVSMLRTPSTAEKGITLWKTGLLTSPTTHLANIGGNLTMRALATASDVPATSLDILASVFTGKRTQHFSPKTIATAVKGGMKGVKNAKEFLRTGIYSDDLLTKYDIPKNVKFENKILNGYTQSIFRSLGAEDIVFRQMAMQESLEKNAWLIAKNEGYKGKAFRGRVQELLKTPSNEMVATAIETAEWSTFQSPNALADAISGLRGGLAGKIKSAEAKGKATLGKKTVLTSAEIFAPFTKTPTNIAARMAEFSPLGFVKAMARAIKPESNRQKEVIESLSRAVTGTGIISLGALLASKGKMTGNVPTNPSERADFFAQGKVPHAILIGDRWYQLNRISPFGNLLSTGAEFHEVSLEEESKARVASRTGFEGLKNLTEQTFLKGIAGALGALTDPERKGQKFVDQTISSTVPTIIGRIAKTIDPKLRLSDNTVQAVQDRLPIVREKLAVRRDIFGRQVETPGGRLNLIDPFATSKDINSPIIDEAQRVNVNIGMPEQTIRGIKLKSWEYSEYQRINGSLTKATLQAIVESDEYKKLPDIDKKEVLEDTVTTIRRTANESVFPALMIIRWGLPADTDPELLNAAISIVNNKEEWKKKSDDQRGDIVKQIVEQL